MFKEFKPAILFVTKFLVIYFAGNILYGIYVESFDPVADPITNWVSLQSVEVLDRLGENADYLSDEFEPNVYIYSNDRIVLSVFEGCNGVNVIVIFVAFLFAYGGAWKRALWFVPLGVLLIHLSNLVRISLLYYVVLYYPDMMYFFHKFLFTGIIYAFVFLLWYWWATRLSHQQTTESTHLSINK